MNKTTQETAEDLRKHITTDQDGNEYYKGVLLDPSWENNPNIMGSFCFYDTETKKYDPPFCALNLIQAKRHYTMVTEQENYVSRFKEQYNLIHIGLYDTTSGTYAPVKHETIIKGEQLK